MSCKNWTGHAKSECACYPKEEADLLISVICPACGLQKSVSPNFFAYTDTPMHDLRKIMSGHDCER